VRKKASALSRYSATLHPSLMRLPIMYLPAIRASGRKLDTREGFKECRRCGLTRELGAISSRSRRGIATVVIAC
jgi:hypothetical protein